MPASGLRTSCATPASSLPSAASRSERRSSVWSRSRSAACRRTVRARPTVSTQRQRDPPQRQARREPVAPERAVEEERVDQPGHRPGGGDHPAAGPNRRGPDGHRAGRDVLDDETDGSVLRIAASTWVSIRSASSGGGSDRPTGCDARVSPGRGAGRLGSGRQVAEELADAGRNSPPRRPRSGEDPARLAPRAGGRARPSRPRPRGRARRGTASRASDALPASSVVARLGQQSVAAVRRRSSRRRPRPRSPRASPAPRRTARPPHPPVPPAAPGTAPDSSTTLVPSPSLDSAPETTCNRRAAAAIPS